MIYTPIYENILDVDGFTLASRAISEQNEGLGDLAAKRRLLPTNRQVMLAFAPDRA
jgi:hypothetical protein